MAYINQQKYNALGLTIDLHDKRLEDSLNGLLKSDGSGNISAAISNIDYSKLSAYVVTLQAIGWRSSNTQDLALANVTQNSNIIVSPDPSSLEESSNCGVYCYKIGDPQDTISFKCSSIPNSDLIMNVVIW